MFKKKLERHGGLALNILRAEWFIKTQICQRIWNSSIITIITMIIIITINNNNNNNNYNSGIVEAYVNWYFRQKKTEKKCICQYVSVKNLI